MNNVDAEKKHSVKSSILSDQKRMILEYIEENGEITEPEICELLNVKRTRAYTLARQMYEE